MNTKGQFNGWQALAEAVREELRECAWLLSLLDQQQKAILARDNALLCEVNVSISEQSAQVRNAREARIGLMIEATSDKCLVPDSSLTDLAALMPDVVRPLFEALAREATSLRKRIKHRTEQNHRMLERFSHNAAELLDVIRPGSITRTYGRKGFYHTSTGLKGSVVRTAV